MYAGDVCLSDLDAVLVRIMPAGSLEQIVLRMDVLFALADQGVPVVNHPKTIEASVDKYLTLVRLAQQRIPVPSTVACQTVANAMTAFDSLGGDVVIKPLFGSMGQGIERLRDRESAAIEFEKRVANSEAIYLQAFVPHGATDLRLFVIGDQVLGMRRTRPGHWLTNVAQGATASAYEPTDCEKKLALKAAKAVGAEVAGVDLVFDERTGKPLVIEVNASPGWQALSEVTGIDVAKQIIDHVAALTDHQR